MVPAVSASAEVLRLKRPIRGGLQAAFVEIDEFEHRLDCSRRQTDLRQALVQALRTIVPPPPLGHESIPHFDLVVRWTVALAKRPLEHFLITCAF